jgi:hypothetical protein
MDTYCNGCKTYKQSYEFIGYGAKGTSKQFKTCNTITDDYLPDSELEIIDLDILK